MKILQEFNARKAKFGFKHDCIGIEDFIPLGKMLEAMRDNFCDVSDFTTEMTGMHMRDFRLYTNSEYVAQFIRNNFVFTS